MGRYLHWRLTGKRLAEGVTHVLCVPCARTVRVAVGNMTAPGHSPMCMALCSWRVLPASESGPWHHVGLLGVDIGGHCLETQLHAYGKTTLSVVEATLIKTVACN